MAEIEKTISLLDQIKLVAKMRQEVEAQGDLKKQMYNEWLKANEYLFNEWGMIAKCLAEAETLLRELTIKAYNETGNKAPAPGVGIRERVFLQYENKVAFDWAKAHKIALMLDTKAFEKIAKADPPDFVKTITEPQATIAGDLEKYITEVK